MTAANGQEERQILQHRPDDEPTLRELTAKLEAALGAGAVERRVQLLALAELARRLMSDQGKDRDHG